MSAKQRILIQLDSDPLPSVFDRVVAVDAGAEHVFSYGGITPDAVRDLVYGAIFTRGGDALARTAIFVGGSDVVVGEAILEAAEKAFLGPLRVSSMLDCAGANTTAAAAAVVAARHGALKGVRALVLGSTGPVGQRVARLLARQGARVRLGSRSADRAGRVAERIEETVPKCSVEPAGIVDANDLQKALAEVEVVVAAGPPGVELLPADARAGVASLRLVIDLNAVPPEGIGGVRGTDAGEPRDGVTAWGALGVGGLKMKIHKRAIARLFEANDSTLDAEEIFELGLELSA